MIEVIHSSSKLKLASNVRVAKSFLSRLKGLMFIEEMKGFDGLLIEPCNSIHNCFVRFPLDVIFLSKENKVVHIIKSFKPWRFSLIYWRSVKVLELRAGTLNDAVTVGDQLEFNHV